MSDLSDVVLIFYFLSSPFFILQDSLGHLSQLQELDVQHNELVGLPAGLGHMAALNILRVNHNRLTKLPSQLGSLCGLQELHAK